MVTATVPPASTTTLTVTVGAAAISPPTAADLSLSTNKTLSLAENATASAGTVTIGAVQDSADEADQEITVSGTTTASAVTLTIEDDDIPLVRITSADGFTVNEDVGTFQVCATVDVTSEQILSVKLWTDDGTAVEPDDYADRDDCTLLFAPVKTNSCGDIPTVNDNVAERAETLAVRVTRDAAQATIVNSPQTVTIIDNDERGVTVSPWCWSRNGRRT